MSDFKDLIRQSTNTPEQHSASQKTEELIRQDEEAKKQAVLFCDWLKKHIQERAQEGLYKLSGDTHIIDGYTYRYTDNSTDWHETKYADVDSIEKVGVDDLGREGSYDKCIVGKEYNHLYETVRVDDFSAGGGLFRKEHTHKWTKTFMLSSLGKKRLSYIQNILKEDDIKISHVWIIRKWKDLHPNFFYQNPKGTLISNEVATSESFTVEQTWNDIVGVYSAFKYEFRY